jgi:hypothetical protein
MISIKIKLFKKIELKHIPSFFFARVLSKSCGHERKGRIPKEKVFRSESILCQMEGRCVLVGTA